MKTEIYRMSNTRTEIIKDLSTKFHSNGEFIIWQKNPKSSERIFKTEANLKEIKIDEGVFSVSISKEDRAKFDNSLPTYFLLKGQDIAFKTKLAIVQSKIENIVNFQFPKEMRMAELRLHPRISFSLDEKKIVEVKFTSKLNNVKVCRTCPVINISEGGICILLSKETLSEIDLKKEIIIDEVNISQFVKKFSKSIVRNARMFSKKTLSSDELFAIGVEFIF